MIQYRGFIHRPWKKSDIDSLCHHANNKRVADQLRDLFPHTSSSSYASAILTFG